MRNVNKYLRKKIKLNLQQLAEYYTNNNNTI